MGGWLHLSNNPRMLIDCRIGSAEVLEVLYPPFLKHGKPTYLRLDTGPEFIARDLRAWLKKIGITTIQIYPGSPWAAC